MKRSLFGLMLVVCMVFSTTAFAAESAPTKAQLEAFVKEAATYAKTQGKAKALAEFSNTKGKFVRGELYIFAYDFNGKVLAHGAKPKLVGLNLRSLKDAKGVYVIQELMKVAQTGSGFLKYYWENPQTKKVMPKLGYVVKMDDNWWLGSGIYYEGK